MRRLRRGLNEAQRQFRDMLDAFVDEHWDGVPQTGRVACWRQACLDAGWSVPFWPAEAGGAGWDATQKYLWSATLARRDVLLPPDPGVDTVGPLLLQSAPAAMRAALLPDIRRLAVSWCLGAAEQDGLDLTQLETVAVPTADGYQLTGQKHYVWGAAGADWMLCFARLEDGVGMFAVALDSAGVTVSATPTFDGGDALAKVELAAVTVPGHLGCRVAVDEVIMRLSGAGARYAGATLAARQLDAIRGVIAEWDDDGLNREADELGVAIEALEAMELRYVDAVGRGAETPFPEVLLRGRARQILLQLGDLQVQSFGYYALPYPDEALLHNEGPIGPEGASAAIRRVLSTHIALQHETAAAYPVNGSAQWMESWKDELAQHLDLPQPARDVERAQGQGSSGAGTAPDE